MWFPPKNDFNKALEKKTEQNDICKRVRHVVVFKKHLQCRGKKKSIKQAS